MKQHLLVAASDLVRTAAGCGATITIEQKRMDIYTIGSQFHWASEAFRTAQGARVTVVTVREQKC